MDLRGRRDDRQYGHRAGLRRHHGWGRLCRLPDPEACNPSPEVSYVCYSVEAFTSDLLHRARCQAGRQTRSSAVASVRLDWVKKRHRTKLVIGSESRQHVTLDYIWRVT